MRFSDLLTPSLLKSARQALKKAGTQFFHHSSMRYLAWSTVILAFCKIAIAHDAATLVHGNRSFGNAGSTDLNGASTDNNQIADTVAIVDQKGGPAPTDPPNLPVNDTSVTAIDGQLVNQPVTRRSTRSSRIPNSRIIRRDASLFRNVFSGKPNGEHDASIEGIAYLTYVLVSNDTYNVEDCLTACSKTDGCVFCNLFYEVNNPGLDNEQSNLKCSLYAQVHTEERKTNRGGQQLGSDPNALTYILNSSGWALKNVVDPDVPDGYELVFGPIDAANNAPGYMGFVCLDRYDPSTCAQYCNDRTKDATGGVCIYFNIWTALVNGVPKTYTCSMYFIATNKTTANNYGQGDLKVTNSRGYVRKSVDIDGGFEKDLTCSDFCFAEYSSYWIGTSPTGGHWDALLFNFAPYARTGNGVATLGSGDGSDSYPGTFTTAQPIPTIPNAVCCLQFWHASDFNGDLESTAFLEIYWNYERVDKIQPGRSNWTVYTYNVIGNGHDVLQFTGGNFPAYDFIDDVYLYFMNCPP